MLKSSKAFTLDLINKEITKAIDASNIKSVQIGRDGLSNWRSAAKLSAMMLANDIDLYWSRAQSAVSGHVDVIDMFSGCGGMSAGFKAVNSIVPAYRLLGAVDIDETANTSYQMNLGHTPCLEDVALLANDQRQLRNWAWKLGRRRKNPLVLIGCAPCQGFSSHRNSAGKNDVRNPLFIDFARVAVALRPDYVVVENVPELLTDRYWSYVESAKKVLEAAGYTVHLSIQNMASFGVSQERFRALLIASRRRFMPLRGFLSRGDFRTVRQSIGSLPAIEAGQRVASDDMHYTATHKPSTIETIRVVPLDGGNVPAGAGPACLRRAEGEGGRSAFRDVYGRLHWDRPAITITAHARNPASGRFTHPSQNRAISVREAALLQGFPSSYSFAGTIDEKYRQVGNAVPPIFASCLAMHIFGELLSREIPTGAMHPGITASLGQSFSRSIPGMKAGSNRMSDI